MLILNHGFIISTLTPQGIPSTAFEHNNNDGDDTK